LKIQKAGTGKNLPPAKTVTTLPKSEAEATTQKAPENLK